MDLPEEDQQDGMRGRLKKAMYGTRDAAQNWELEYSEMMTEAGFTQGSHRACVFYHKEKDVRAVVCEKILLHLDRGAAWIGSVKSFSIAWRASSKPDWRERDQEQ